MTQVCSNTQVLIVRSGCSCRHCPLSKPRGVSRSMAATLLKGEDASYRQARTHAENVERGSLWPVYSSTSGRRGLGHGRVQWAEWGSASTVVPWKEPELWGPRDLGSDSGSVTYGLGLSASHCGSESQFSHLSNPIYGVAVKIKRDNLCEVPGTQEMVDKS